MPLVHTTRLPTGATFNQKRADHVIKFVEAACVHTKSSWAGKPFTLATWQRGSATQDRDGWLFDGILTPLFGTVRWDTMFNRWVRQYNMAWIEVARKNGKSEIMAALGLYLLICDGEQAAEVYSAASDKRQASMVFDVARDMIYRSKHLKRMLDRGELRVIDSRKRIVHVKSRSFYQVVSADVASNLGANPHAILFDEVLAQPNRQLWDVLRQGAGTRPQTLMIGVTTAGPNRESFAYQEHEFSLQVADNPDLDPKRFVYMAYTDEEHDWLDERHWYDANPALWTERNPDGWLSIETLRAEAIEAKNKGDLSEVANFCIFRLNRWGTGSNGWLDMGVWDESEAASGTFTDEDIGELRAVGGLDLAETMDLAAWVLVFTTPERVMVKPHFFITRKAIRTRHKRMMSRFLEWESAGLITVFDQDVHDYDVIRDHIMSDIETYRLDLIGFDQFQAPAIISAIESRSDVVCVKVPQTTTRMNPGSKELTRLMGVRRLTTNANPVLRWNAANATYKMDAERNIKPDKRTSTDSIDGVVALVNALTVMVTEPEPVEPYFYSADECPRCHDYDVVRYNDDTMMCRECGHAWRETVDA